MKLAEKYRLALIQLQAFSDNELIMVDDITLNIAEELANLTTQSTKSTCYLFGSEAINSYEKGGIKRLLKDIEKYSIGYGSFEFIEGETQSFELIEASDSWMDYLIIPKEDYEQL